jgi:hypothetical protein
VDLTIQCGELWSVDPLRTRASPIFWFPLPLVLQNDLPSVPKGERKTRESTSVLQYWGLKVLHVISTLILLTLLERSHMAPPGQAGSWEVWSSLGGFFPAMISIKQKGAHNICNLLSVFYMVHPTGQSISYTNFFLNQEHIYFLLQGTREFQS